MCARFLRSFRDELRVLTILFGLASAVGWGAPDAVLAQAVRRVGAFPVVFGSIVIGTVLASPLALFLDLPDWTERSLLLAPLVGILSVVGFQAGFMSFRDGAVSVVAPIIACEGGVAALFALAGGEHVDALVLLGLPLAVAGVVLVSRGEGESSRAGVLPATIAALIWGGVLALSAPIAHDLGAGWAFLLVRGVPRGSSGGAWRSGACAMRSRTSRSCWRPTTGPPRSPASSPPSSARSVRSWPWSSSVSDCAGVRSPGSPSWRSRWA
jgi:uncharacterized membrane protein